MMITTTVKMDLQRKGPIPRMDAVQGDTNTRALALELYEHGQVWEIPGQTNVQVRYSKPDGTGGVYDTLPDGTPAGTTAGNLLTLTLVPQMFTAAGLVRIQADLVSGTDSLATFPIHLVVEQDVAAEVIRSEDYVNMRLWLQDSLDQALDTALQQGTFTPQLRVGTVKTVSAGSNAGASFSGTAKEPVLNLEIPEGYTPQKGTDYWTDDDVEGMQRAVKEALEPQIIAQAQKAPGFADSIADCTDTERLYVLPNGYLYAYTQVNQTGFSGTNRIPTSESLDSTAIYNGVGYKNGFYISSSSGADAEKEGHVTTGLIAYTVKSAAVPETVYIRGGTPDRIAYYHSDKSFRLTIRQTTSNLFVYEQLDTDYWKATPVMADTGNSALYENQGAGGYLRFDVICQDGAELMITVGEEIEESTQQSYQWTNTGHAFVPMDYEERILALEADGLAQEQRILDLGIEAVAQEERISALEDGSVPAYVQQEAERVADLALEKRNAQCLCFAALSDIHYPYDDGVDNTTTEQSLVHAAMGITELRKRLPMDFLGLLGDHVRGAGSSTVAESKTALKLIRRTMYEAGLGISQFWLQGNHDRNPYDTDDGDLTDDELYAYLFAGNTGLVVDQENVQRGYGYQDFEAQRIRVICLNSSDISGAQTVSDHQWSAAQLRWLAQVALDFSGKSDPTQWGVVVLSHQPMNWGTVPAFTILDGYASRTGGTAVATEGEEIPFDFTDIAGAQIICCVNGHTHNFRCARIGTNNIWQIAVPQICAGRYNEYGVSWPEVGGELNENGEPVYYYKTANSAKTTSFCLFLIDRKNRKIHALHYGAGIDRELDY